MITLSLYFPTSSWRYVFFIHALRIVTHTFHKQMRFLVLNKHRNAEHKHALRIVTHTFHTVLHFYFCSKQEISSVCEINFARTEEMFQSNHEIIEFRKKERDDCKT